ncbi:hypothetical protein D3C76_971700 [compost metagenome]
MQGTDPVEHHRVAQAHFAADVQHLVTTLRQRQVAARGFPGLHQLVGIHHESFAVGRQAGATAAADEQLARQLLLQLLHPRGDRRLGHVQTFGGGDQAATADDFKESAGQLDIHGGCRMGKVAHSSGFAQSWGELLSIVKGHFQREPCPWS